MGPKRRLCRKVVPGMYFSEKFLYPSLVLAARTEPPVAVSNTAPPTVTRVVVLLFEEF